MRKTKKMEKITDQYPLYSRLLVREIESRDDLPEFSNEDSLFIMSDYGGEHKGADFNTYSFLITSPDRLSEFIIKSSEIRKSYKLVHPFKEYSYKDLKSVRVKKALDSYLEISNSLISGILVTIAVDRDIQSLFGKIKKESHKQIMEILLKNNLGEWKGPVAEKLFRVCHAISIYLSFLTKSGQKFMWMSDCDSINDNGKLHDFKHTQEIFIQVLKMYSGNDYDICGFAKPFNEEPFTYDLLSLADFAAGGIQEVLQSKINNRTVSINKEKQKIIQWLASPGILLKHNYVFTKNSSDFDIGRVDLKTRV